MLEDKSVRDEFIAESENHLTRFEKLLLAMDQTADSKAAIHELFRAMHSIKGGAAFLGLDKLNRLSHALENVLVRLREDLLHLTPQTIDLLLKGQDAIRELFSNIDRMDEVDTGQLDDEIAQLENNGIGFVSSGLRKPKDPPTSGVIQEDGVQLELEWGGKSKKLWLQSKCLDQVQIGKRIVMELDLLNLPELPAPQGPISWMRWLSSRGRVLGGVIDSSSILLRKSLPLTPLNWICLFETDLSLSELSQNLGPDAENQTLFYPLISLKRIELPSQDSESRSGTERLAKPLLEQLNDQMFQDFETPSFQGQGLEREALPAAKSRNENLRVNLSLLEELMRLATELVLTRNQVVRVLHSDPSNKSLSKHLNQITTHLQEAILRTRMQPLTSLTQRLQRIVRDLSRRLNKSFELVLEGENVEVDKNVLDSLIDPLTHLVRNACDHGIEEPEQRQASGKPITGRILLRAFQEAGQIHLVIRDDGAGMDVERIRERAIEKGLRTMQSLQNASESELLNLIFLPGFSTALQISEISGRGVGLDVVRTNVEKMGGIIHLESSLGRGSTFSIRLPLTLVIVPCLIVASGKERYAIPLVHVLELGVLYDQQIEKSVEIVSGQEMMQLRKENLPLVRLKEVLAKAKPFTSACRRETAMKYRLDYEKKRNAFLDRKERNLDARFNESLRYLVLQSGLRRMVLSIDEVLGSEDVVVKPLHSFLRSMESFAGATLLDNGQMALVLHIAGIFRYVGMKYELFHPRAQERKFLVKSQIMLFQCGDQKRFALPLTQVRRVVALDADQTLKLITDPFWRGDAEPIPVLIACFEDRRDVLENWDGSSRHYLLLVREETLPFAILFDRLLGIESEELVFLERDVPSAFFGVARVRGEEYWFPDLYALQNKLVSKAEFRGLFLHQGGPEVLAHEKSGRILALESDPLARMALKNYLKPHELEWVDEAALLIPRLRESKFDLILVGREPDSSDARVLIKELRRFDLRIPAVALVQRPLKKGENQSDPCGYDGLYRVWDKQGLRAVYQNLTTKGREFPEGAVCDLF